VPPSSPTGPRWSGEQELREAVARYYNALYRKGKPSRSADPLPAAWRRKGGGGGRQQMVPATFQERERVLVADSLHTPDILTLRGLNFVCSPCSSSDCLHLGIPIHWAFYSPASRVNRKTTHPPRSRNCDQMPAMSAVRLWSPPPSSVGRPHRARRGGRGGGSLAPVHGAQRVHRARRASGAHPPHVGPRRLQCGARAAPGPPATGAFALILAGGMLPQLRL